MDVQLEIAKMQQDTARETVRIQAQSAQETAHEISSIQAEALFFFFEFNIRIRRNAMRSP